jgi:hypothetical protein
MKLVDNARHAWKWLSTQMLAVTGAMPGVWLTLPAEWRSAIPPTALAIAALVTAAIGIYGRVTVTKVDPQ